MFSKISQGDAFGEIVFDQDARGLGHKKLPAVPRGAHPLSPVDIHSYIASGRNQGFTRVNDHSHTEIYAISPGVCGVRGMSFERRVCRVFCSCKYDSEGVPLVTDFMAT